MDIVFYYVCDCDLFMFDSLCMITLLCRVGAAWLLFCCCMDVADCAGLGIARCVRAWCLLFSLWCWLV